MSNHESALNIYADAVQVSVGNFGVTLTLLLSNPDRPDELGEVQGRVRLSPELAEAIARILTDGLAKRRADVEAEAKS
jgi:hypothetical protein